MKLRIHAAAGAAITGNRLPHAAAKATEAAVPEATEAAPAAPRRIADRRLQTNWKSCPRSPARPDVIANQVFLAIPWRGVRPRYEHCVDYLRSRSPLSFVIVGRADSQNADDLLAVIKERLASSSYAVFDASGGNANVSLEYGYAEATDIPRAIYISTHGRTINANSDPPIIADLAGKRRNQYKQEAGLRHLLKTFSDNHPYTIRFERFLSDAGKRLNKGTKKRNRALALKIIHALDGQTDVRRADIVQQLLADQSRYADYEVDSMISRLHNARLIRSQRGRYARVQIA
jgi:hypothetical protein